MLSAHDEYVDEEDFADDDHEYDDFDDDEEGDILSIDDASLLEFLEDNIEMLLQAVAVDDTVVLSRIHTMHATTQMTDTEDSKKIAAGLHRLITLAEADDGRRSLAIAASSSEPWTEFVLQFYEEPYPRPSNEELLCDIHRNPLHYAAMSDDDNSNVIELLAGGLDRGTAMIMEEDDDGNTPLLYAAHFANVRCLKEILGAVLDEYQDDAVLSLIQRTNAENLNSLHFAVFSGSSETLQVLIDWLEMCTKTKLENSGDNLSAEEINQLVAKEVKRILHESSDAKHRNLVHAAASCRSIGVTELLLKYDLNLFSTDKDRMSIVHWAVRGPDMTDATFEYVQYMADLGLDLTSKDCKNRTALHFSAYYGHQKVCEHLVKEAQLSVMATDRQGWNALHYAASTGSPALPILLHVGDDANPALTKNRKRMTPLHVAACKAKSGVFQQMVEFTTAEELSCFYNAVDYRGRTYLFYCARNNLFHGAHLLLDQAKSSNDIGLHSVDNTGKSVFHAAAMSGALEVAQLVIDRFGREELDGLLRSTDKKGRTVFHLAAACGQPEMIEWAFSEDLGDLVSIVDKDGNLPLHYAARFGEMGCFFDLLGEAELTESMEKIMAKNKDGQTVLHAGAAGDAIMLEYLLDLISTVETAGGERHEILTCKDRHGMSPLMIAASNGNWNTVSTLLANRPEALLEKDAYGRSLLHLAAMADTSDLLSELSRQEANDTRLSLSAPADDGTLPLHFAAHHGSSNSMQWLLFDANNEAGEGEVQQAESAGVDVNAVDEDGRTALHHAALQNHLECVKLLCAHPAVNVLAKDSCGRTAIDAASYAGNAVVVDCLLDVAAAKEIDFSGGALQDNGGRHPLHVAVSQGHLDVCEVLLENHNVDANVADNLGRTPLHRASLISPEMVQLLVDNRADVDAQDKKGRTALMYCATNLDEDIMRLLLEDAEADADITDKKGRTFDKFLPIDSDDESGDEESE